MHFKPPFKIQLTITPTQMHLKWTQPQQNWDPQAVWRSSAKRTCTLIPKWFTNAKTFPNSTDFLNDFLEVLKMTIELIAKRDRMAQQFQFVLVRLCDGAWCKQNGKISKRKRYIWWDGWIIVASTASSAIKITSDAMDERADGTKPPVAEGSGEPTQCDTHTVAHIQGQPAHRSAVHSSSTLIVHTHRCHCYNIEYVYLAVDAFLCACTRSVRIRTHGSFLRGKEKWKNKNCSAFFSAFL